MNYDHRKRRRRIILSQNENVHLNFIIVVSILVVISNLNAHAFLINHHRHIHRCRHRHHQQHSINQKILYRGWRSKEGTATRDIQSRLGNDQFISFSSTSTSASFRSSSSSLHLSPSSPPSSMSSSSGSSGSGGGESCTDYSHELKFQLGKPVELRYTTYYDGKVVDNGDDTALGNKSEEQHEPVILLHGLLGQKRNFASLCTSLSTQLTKKRTIYALDLRNHGDNHHDWRDEMSYTHMCHDVLAFMDTKALRNVVLIGHSMGGKVAKSLALSYPDRIAGLVVLDIAPVKYTAADPAWKAVKGIIDSLRDVKIERGMTKRNVDRDLRATVEDPALRAFVLTNLEEGMGGGRSSSSDGSSDGMLQWKININSISTQLDVIAGFDYLQSEIQSNNNYDNDASDVVNTPRKTNIYEGDTFFINGGTSSFVKGKHMEVISQYFPNYMLTTIRGSGHWVHAEAPDDTLALLKRYLDR